ncbi:hypothetical protein NSQ54_09825 [Alkalihalobacillus sp. FSL W8-0930]
MMNTLIITSYVVGKNHEKSILFKSTESKDIHQLMFDGLKALLAEEDVDDSFKTAEQLSVNMIEQESGQSLPRIQHFSLSGKLEDRLLDRLEDIQDWMDQHHSKEVFDHSSNLSRLISDLS